ncbi:MAG: SpoIIE family protein phosphatase, partial [Clostridiales bacterium]|nr:SpoIIE family protein phosphatase [Clostridiales bacterium]
REQSTAGALRRMQRQTAEELGRMSHICGELAGLFAGAAVRPPQTDLIRGWTVHGAMRVCADCEARILCWADAARMGEAVLALIFRFDRGERISPVAPVDEGCRHFSEMVTAAHLSYHQALAEKAHRERLARQNAYVNRQLRGVGDALTSLAGRVAGDGWLDGGAEVALQRALSRRGIPALSVDVIRSGGTLLARVAVPAGTELAPEKLLRVAGKSLGFGLRLLRTETMGKATVYELEEAKGLRASVAVVSLPERADGVSGDATGEYRLQGCRVLYALSDGMGSGPLARQESNAAIALLFDLCRIGFARELVYENVNRLLHARAQAEMYATLDAVTLDLATGDAELMKYGAPPTYLVRGGRVKLLAGEALPCGIVDEARPTLHRFRLEKEDILVLCSDGVYDRLGSRAEQAIADGLALSQQQLAQTLIEAARARGQKDDMTVMVIRVA